MGRVSPLTHRTKPRHYLTWGHDQNSGREDCRGRYDRTVLCSCSPFHYLATIGNWETEHMTSDTMAITLGCRPPRLFLLSVVMIKDSLFITPYSSKEFFRSVVDNLAKPALACVRHTIVRRRRTVSGRAMAPVLGGHRKFAVVNNVILSLPTPASTRQLASSLRLRRRRLRQTG